MRINELIEKVKRAKLRAEEVAREAFERLNRGIEGIRIFEIDSSDDLPERIVGVDGGFRSITAFVNDLVLIKVARVIQEGKTVRIEGGIDGGFWTYKYGQDTIVDGESVEMLTYEAKAVRGIEGIKFLDGPFINPNIPSSASMYYSLRTALIDQGAYAFVKRHRRTFLRGILKDLGLEDISEGILVIHLFNLKREESGPSKALAIGPFSYETNNRTIYARYVQRTLGHKAIVIEHNKPELPRRLFSNIVWPPSVRSRQPLVLELAHASASIKDQEASNFFSIVYRLLKEKSP